MTRPRREPAPTPSRPPTPAAPDGVDPAERRLAALRAATSARRADAAGRAEAGLRKLIKDGAEINFRSVARAGKVSLNFLYDHPELRGRIEGLRARQEAARPQRPSVEPHNTDSNIVRTLAAQLKEERVRHRGQVRDLEARLAAAHHEILRLKRAPHPEPQLHDSTTK